MSRGVEESVLLTFSLLFHTSDPLTSLLVPFNVSWHLLRQDVVAQAVSLLWPFL